MMKILNGLPVLKSCLECWEKPPTHKEFIERYADPMIPYAKKFFHGWGAPFSDHLEWNRYRTEALHVDPHQEEARVAHWVRAVERLFGFELEGEIILCGAFEEMDGFARFDRGTHRVFLGVDESHRQGPYLDILETHELTHVARESRPEVWQGWGLDPKMERAVYVEAMPDIEHLISEGLACAVSEILVPGQDPWKYCYQTEETYRYVMTHAQAVDREIQNELNHPRGDWSR